MLTQKIIQKVHLISYIFYFKLVWELFAHPVDSVIEKNILELELSGVITIKIEIKDFKKPKFIFPFQKKAILGLHLSGEMTRAK